MKNNIVTLILLLVVITGCSQNSKYEYTGRYTPSIKQEILNEADFISDIMPEFTRYFTAQYDQSIHFDDQINLVDYPMNKLNDPEKSYIKIMEFVSVEILATCQKNILNAESTSDRLTLEQKNILNTIDLGTDIKIKIKFRYANQAKSNLGCCNKIMEGYYTVTAIPATEAEYPGGFKKLSEYINNNVFDKISGGGYSENISQSIVNFMVNEEGQVVDVKIARTSTDMKTDKLLLDVINKMPRWKPAKNSKGINVKQELNIPLGHGGC